MLRASRWPLRVLVLSLPPTILAALLVSSAPAVASGSATPVDRRSLGGAVYEFDYLVRTGAGAHHEVGVHRVVQVVNGQPIATDKALFMLHGDAWNFNGAFLGGAHSPDSLPYYLASRGVDVWGIDLGWTLVPQDTRHFGFMKHWGLQRDIDDLEQALAFARMVRTQTGSPGDPLTLLGWSRGGWIGYSLLNQESQKPIADRQVRAFISVDNAFKVRWKILRNRICAFERSRRETLAQGIYAYKEHVIARLGKLAKKDPDGESPIFGPPYTNLDAALTYAAAVFKLGPGYAPYYHFFGGTFPDGQISRIPDGLRYTQLRRMLNFLAGVSPYESVRVTADADGITCGDTHTTFDDHLRDITVPVLYVGAAGGFGREGLYTLSLLGSTDETSHIVSFFGRKKSAFDFGHADLFNARRAGKLVWTPIYQWLVAHPPTS
jgi:hypothetical protein